MFHVYHSSTSVLCGTLFFSRLCALDAKRFVSGVPCIVDCSLVKQLSDATFVDRCLCVLLAAPQARKNDAELGAHMVWVSVAELGLWPQRPRLDL